MDPVNPGRKESYCANLVEMVSPVLSKAHCLSQECLIASCDVEEDVALLSGNCDRDYRTIVSMHFGSS